MIGLKRALDGPVRSGAITRGLWEGHTTFLNTFAHSIVKKYIWQSETKSVLQFPLAIAHEHSLNRDHCLSSNIIGSLICYLSFNSRKTLCKAFADAHVNRSLKRNKHLCVEHSKKIINARDCTLNFKRMFQNQLNMHMSKGHSKHNRKTRGKAYI